MKPVILSAYTMSSSLGHGLEATRAALAAGASGLAPCTFETVTLATFTGEIPGVDAARLPRELASLDCRNNRAAEAKAFALEEHAVEMAAHGPCRRRRARVYSATEKALCVRR